jgi:hypothetical protein
VKQETSSSLFVVLALLAAVLFAGLDCIHMSSTKLVLLIVLALLFVLLVQLLAFWLFG